MDFLLELRCEEIPARMQAGARRDLEKLFIEQMNAAGVKAGAVTIWSTPRRLALIVRDMPLATEAVSEELKGPRTNAPEQALEGFLRKTGLSKDQLTERDGVWFAMKEQAGRDTKSVLAEAIPAIIRAFPWPKSMRWGAASLSTESLRWVRPLSGIVAILGEGLVPCEIDGLQSGFATKGHRFHAPGDITIGGAGDYQDKLRACHVIVDHAEREALIRDGARKAAEAAGLDLVEDEGLVIENAGLTEWPVPLLGRFDEAYLEVPPEVIQLTARTNQKYFVCEQNGKLANAFICTSNITASDGGEAIVAGNRKVLAARLSDARFFWEQDRKKSLVQHAEGLARITFHEKLGTVANKVERVAKLAEWLASEGIVPSCDPVMARQAAELCKADLTTEMVGEFPELQGLMGGYYARAERLDERVADAIRDHYKPVGQGDDVPTAPVTVAVSLADKLDTLSGFFHAEMPPTGSRDPFALRRAAIGVNQIIIGNRLRLSFESVILRSLLPFAKRELVGSPATRHQKCVVLEQTVLSSAGRSSDVQTLQMHNLVENHAKIMRSYYALLDFFADRLKVQQRDAGVRHDLIDAVFALGGEDDLVRLLARVHALQAFVGTEDGTNLLAGYKRAANILKKEEFTVGGHNPHPEPAEAALMAALNSAKPLAEQAVKDEQFARAMAALATLRAPIDAFFEQVMVNDPDPAKRAARLTLLSDFRDAVNSVADFSRIDG